MVAADAEALRADLAAIRALPMERDRELVAAVIDEVALDRLASRECHRSGRFNR